VLAPNLQTLQLCYSTVQKDPFGQQFKILSIP